MHEKKNEVADSIAFVGRIIQQKTLKSLMRCYNREINKFFGFEHVCLMFHDNEKDQLYTITFGDEDEMLSALDKQRKAAKDQKEVEVIDAIQDMRDVMISASQIINFPISTGITSQVFRTQKPMYFNDFNQQANRWFVAEIDNVLSLKGIQNILVSAM